MADEQRERVPAPWHPTYDVDKVIRDALEEDTAGIGDLSSLSTVPAPLTARGTFLAKADGVLAGQAVADRVFAVVDPSVQVVWRKRDGDALCAGDAFAVATGPARSLLLAERLALNFMQRMSGVATATARMVAEADRGSEAAAAAAAVAAASGNGQQQQQEQKQNENESEGGKSKAAAATRRCRVLETRKTAPGLRLFDKWAVLIGGGSNHRMGLFDMVMVKDNHVEAAGGVAKAVAAVAEFLRSEKGRAAAAAIADARRRSGGEGAAGGEGDGAAPPQIPVEIEVRTLAEVDELVAVLRAAGRGGGAAAAAAGGAGAGGDGGNGDNGGASSAPSSGSGGGEVVTRVMLDNMVRRLTPEEAARAREALPPPQEGTPEHLERAAGVNCSALRAAVARLAPFCGAGGGGASGGGGGWRALETEASGNVTEATAAAVAACGVDFVSVGALTHSVTALDVSFNIET